MIKKETNVIAIPKEGLIHQLDKTTVENSILIRNINNEEQLIKYPIHLEIKPTETLEVAYYAGYKIDHFGHFLLESLRHLAEMPGCKNINKIIWISYSGNNEFSKWQLEILQILGLDTYEHIVISKPTLVKNLFITEPGYIISNKFTDKHASFLGKYQTKIIKNKKVWLSRKGIDGNWINEEEIENHLKENGWTIFTPHLYSIKEQLEMVLSSEIIAGIEGSAFHLLILAKNIKNKIIIFSRRAQENCNGNRINDNYILISRTKKFRQEVYYPKQIHINGEGIKAKFLVDPSEVLMSLGVEYYKSFDYFQAWNKYGNKKSIKNKLQLMSLNDCIDVLWVCSIYLEKKSMYHESLNLLQTMQKMRPKGKLIEKKIIQLKETIKHDKI